MILGRHVLTAMVLRLMWTCASVPVLRGPRIMDWCLGLLLRWLTMEIGDAIGIRRATLSLIVVAAMVVGMRILSAHRLRNIWNNLHSTGNYTSRTSAPGRIG